MKKVLAFICAVTIVSVAFAGCGNESANVNLNSTTETTINIKDESKTHLKNAYNNLIYVNSELEAVSSTIQEAWYYGIFEDNCSLAGLSSEIWIPASEFEKIDLSNFDVYDFTSCVVAVCKVYQSNGKFSDIKSNLDNAKSEIQSATDDIDNYEDMKNYYSSCLAYYDWLQYPGGNFNQFTDTINQYNIELNGYKNDLEFDYGQ